MDWSFEYFKIKASMRPYFIVPVQELLFSFKIKGKKYNCAILINRKGKIKGVYKKINLYGDKVSKGKTPFIISTEFGKIGIAICWDLNFSWIFSEMRKKQVKIIFCPSLWWYDSGVHENNNLKFEKKLLQSLIHARAFENLCYVCIINPAKESKYHVAYTGISSPSRIIKEIYKNEGLIVSELNLKKLEKLEKICSYNPRTR